MRKRARVEVLRKGKVLANLVLEVRNVGAAVVPADLLMLCFLLAVYRHFHPVIKHRIRLVVVQYVEFDGEASASVLNTEVKPLRVTMRIDVVLHEAVVLLVTNLGGKEEIA